MVKNIILSTDLIIYDSIISQKFMFIDYLRIVPCLFKEIQLHNDAMKVLLSPNAGGNSILSETISMEYLTRKFNAHSITTEMEVEYFSPHWKKVDFVVTINSTRVGISVTRAMGFPNPYNFTEKQAYHLMMKKLHGLVVARDGTFNRGWNYDDGFFYIHSESYISNPNSCFQKCILHILCQTERIANIIYKTIPRVRKKLNIDDDVIIVATVVYSKHLSNDIFYQKNK